MLETREWGTPDAPVIGFWPGLGSTALAAFELAPMLTARGWRVVAIDPPFAPEEDYDTRSLADRMAAATTVPFVAMGHSWGAVVSAFCAARHPERVRGLVLVDGGFTAIGNFPGATPGLDLEQRIAKFADELRGMSWSGWEELFGQARSRIGRWSPGHEEVARDRVRQVNGRLVPRMPLESAVAVIRALDADDPAQIRAGISQPVLLLLGTEPPARREALEPYVREFCAAVPHAEVRWLPNATHDVPADLGPELGEIVADWLAEAL
jgi:pimeloyl-ACP methyl ester carboxylesterase